MHRSLFPPLLFCVLLALNACTGVTERAGPPAESALDEAAQPLTARGDYLSAAQLYLSAAKTAPENTRAGLRLKAAELLAQGSHWAQLQQVLAGLQPDTLPPEQATRYYLVAARHALAVQQPEQALALLARVGAPDTLPDRGQEYYRLRADAYERSGNPMEAARQLIRLDRLLADPKQKLDNQYRIWEQLSSLSSDALRTLATAAAPDTLSGWMELVLITREDRSDRERWSQQLQQWRERYPRHPAEDALLPDLLYQVGQFVSRANRIAVLLPFSGAAADAANAIRDGLLAAYYQSDDPEPALRFYDTAGNAQLIWSIYQRAIGEGADFVIGPLLKDSIQALSRSGLLPVPVLALNQIEAPPGNTVSDGITGSTGSGEVSGGSGGANGSVTVSDGVTGNVANGDSGSTATLPLYQFGLAPEDEARQAATRMLADGHQRVVALIPDNAWGTRVFQAFDQQFLQLGGDVVALQQYDDSNADLSKPIRRLFNLDDSDARHQALQRLLGERLNFEPRRRQDAQAVFVLAFPRAARQIKPQLRFHHAGDLPVYSTSHVYQASDDPDIDRDMDGLMFCDIPWALDAQGNWATLRQKTETLWPERGRRYQRLFALGFDAYQIAPWLDTMHLPGFAQFPGATGVLSLDDDRQLHRALEWARFNRGVPELISEPALTSTEGHDEPESQRQ